MIKDFLQVTFTNRYKTVETRPFKVMSFIKFFIVFTILVFSVIGLITVVMGSVPKKGSGLASMSVLYGLFIYIIRYPLLEETVFRLWLKPGKYNHYISLACCLGTLLYMWIRYGLDNIFTWYYYIVLIAVILINKFTSGKDNNHFRLWMYISAILFGFVHLNNYADVLSIDIWKYPLLVFPQLCLGLAAAYIRLRYGFKYSVLLHSVNNFIPWIMFVLFAASR